MFVCWPGEKDQGGYWPSGWDRCVCVEQVERKAVCVDVAQVEKQRDELKADKDKVAADRDRLQQEWVTLQAEMQKRDIQMEEMKKEVGALL